MKPSPDLPAALRRPNRLAIAVLSCLAAAAAVPAAAQQADAPAKAAGSDASVALEQITVTGNWLGSDTPASARTFPGARTLVDREAVQASGAVQIGDVLRRLPGVQSTDNSSTAGSSISLNIGIRGLTGRYSPRSTVLLDGIPIGVAPYGQPQLSFAPVSLNNIESIDVIRGGGAVRYGPQNVGGIINFKTRSVPAKPGLVGDVALRQNHYSGSGEDSTMLSAFLGTQLDNGLGLAFLYSGLDGAAWRKGSDERYNDASLKFRYALSDSAELYGKLSYYDVRSRTPGGLTVAQFNADPFQNTRPTDFWEGERKGFDMGYLNTLSEEREVEVRFYYNESMRSSALINAARTQLAYQPRNYTVMGIEPRFTQRLGTGALTHDVTVGYRYLRERGDDNAYSVTLATGLAGPTTTFDNANDAHSVYIDDKIAFGAWRVTPGVRYERIESERRSTAGGAPFVSNNSKALPSLNVAYLLSQSATLFANYNTSFGAVQNTQLNSQTAANPLRPEVAKTAELGARWEDARVTAEVTLYRMKFDNQIQQIAGTTPPLFQNVGETKHSGVELAGEYRFDKASALGGMAVYANYAYTRALQDSGPTAGLDLPFYSRHIDTVGARYGVGPWTFNLSTSHQSDQYSDNANTETEPANATNGKVPGFRVWNVQASWQPNPKGPSILVGVNNIADKRYYTRNVDSNAGRMVGAPRTVYVQGRYAF
jgi:Fe(3+) dicitrate transport protein